MAFFNVHRLDLSNDLHYTNKIVGHNVRSIYKQLENNNEIMYGTFPSSDLFAPTRAERSFFVLSVALLFVLSMCGNILTIFVNLRRKMRPFFRVCLISLACSDLLTTFFLSITYMSQFSADYVQFWSFSESMCHVVPFITTSAIIVSSLSLLGIAADRYYALRSATNTVWNPTCTFCLLCFVLIWAASITISSPIYFIYELVYLYIPLIDTTNFSEEESPKLISMCTSNQEKIGLFYMLIFFAIFTPCIVAFFWLNIIIAVNIWQRRRPINRNIKNENETSTIGISNVQTLNASYEKYMTPTTKQTQMPNKTTTQTSNSAREIRHIRLFVIIILMMLVFLVCRLPAWVLLMLRMYGLSMNDTCWRLYFYFGLMHLSSCMLNPLFYTFLSETIEYARLVKLKLCNTACGLRVCCHHSRSSQNKIKVQHIPSTIYEGVDGVTSLPSDRIGCYLLCCQRAKVVLVSSSRNTIKRKQQSPDIT